MMNKLMTGIFFLLCIVLVSGCKKNDNEDDNLAGDWNRKADFGGASRSDAVVFVIGNKAYVGTGFTSSVSSTENRLADFWEYDETTDDWYAIADFPGKKRSKAVAFSANGKGYVGLGTDGSEVLSDFWEYTPTLNSWKRVADFPVLKGRYGAVSFSLNNFGYVGCGNDGDNDQQDFYQYNPISNQWTQISSIKSKRVYPFAFVIDNKAYVGSGTNNGAYVSSFYCYDPSTNTWTRKHSLNPDGDSEESDDIKDNDDYNYNLQRISTAAFTLNGYGYISTGTNYSVLDNTWQYNPNSDIWVQVDKFEGTSREGAVGFAINNYGFIATGRSGTLRLDDLWRFDPSASDDD